MREAACREYSCMEADRASLMLLLTEDVLQAHVLNAVVGVPCW